jgi:hypothetical protein
MISQWLSVIKMGFQLYNKPYAIHFVEISEIHFEKRGNTQDAK